MNPNLTVEFGKDKYHLQNDMIQWCRDNLGTGGWRQPSLKLWGDHWGIVCAFGNTTFYFIEEKDAIMFRLRWA